LNKKVPLMITILKKKMKEVRDEKNLSLIPSFLRRYHDDAESPNRPLLSFSKKNKNFLKKGKTKAKI